MVARRLPRVDLQALPPSLSHCAFLSLSKASRLLSKILAIANRSDELYVRKLNASTSAGQICAIHTRIMLVSQHFFYNYSDSHE